MPGLVIRMVFPLHPLSWYTLQAKESGPAELMLSWKGEAKVSI